MAGPLHFFYGLGIGLALAFASRGKKNYFTAMHVFVFAFNNYLGPDFGAIWWYTTRLSDPAFSQWGIILFHNPWGWIIQALWLSLVWYYLINRGIMKIFVKQAGSLETAIERGSPPLHYVQCYELLAAGGISHFFIDYLTAKNNAEILWMWETGWWDNPQIQLPSNIIALLLSVGMLLGIIGINGPLWKTPIKQKQVRTLILILSCGFAYFVMLAIFRWGIGINPVGEEADLGGLVFLGSLVFLPLALCIASMNERYWTQLPKTLRT